MKRFPAVWLFVLGMLGAAHDATAQRNIAPQVPGVELWGAVTGVPNGPAGSLVTSYSPPLLFDGDFTSRGGQTLEADAGFAVGLTGGVNVFPTRRVGFQILFDRVSADMSAMNTPYTVALQYVSRLPPNDEAQIVNVNQSISWPNTSGSLVQTAVAFNAVVRIGRADRLSATLSGGPTYDRFSGAVQPIGFTTFHLGGHSVLFQDNYRLALSLEPAHAFGFDASGEVGMAVSRHAAIIAGYRYFGGPEADVTATPTAILNADELTFREMIADVASRLALAPMRMSVSSSHLFIGVRFMR